jgi:hypothetical protein
MSPIPFQVVFYGCRPAASSLGTVGTVLLAVPQEASQLPLAGSSNATSQTMLLMASGSMNWTIWQNGHLYRAWMAPSRTHFIYNPKMDVVKRTESLVLLCESFNRTRAKNKNDFRKFSQQ